MASSSNNRIERPYLLIATLILVIAFLSFARQVLMPLALSVLLAFVLSPLVTRLQRWGLARTPAVVVVVTLVFAGLGLFGWMLSRQFTEILVQLPNYEKQIVEKFHGLRNVGDTGVVGSVRRTIEDITHKIGGSGRSADGQGPRESAAVPSGEAAGTPGAGPGHPLYVTTAPSPMSRFIDVAGPAGEALVTAALVVILVVFMLVYRENLRDRFVRLGGRGRLILTTRAFEEGTQRISRYLAMLVIINTLFALVMSVGLFVLGMASGAEPLYRYAILWGVLCATLRFIPYLGTWCGAALLCAFSVATVPGWGVPLAVLVYFCLVELVTANVGEPLLFGHSTGSSPIALLVSAAFWTWLWGPVGLILSTPLTVVLVVVGKYVRQLQFLEVLLGDDSGLQAETNFYQRLLAHDLDQASDLAEEFLQTHDEAALYEQLIMPALVMARADRDKGELDAEAMRYVVQAMREVTEDLPTEEKTNPGDGRRGKLLACPARDEADEVCLELLARLLRPAGFEVEILSAELLSAEKLARLAGESDPVVCIGTLAPGGLAEARYLCKRIRASDAARAVVVARFGESADALEKVSKRLHGAGATKVTATLAQTRAAVVPQLQVAAAQPAGPKVGPAALPA